MRVGFLYNAQLHQLPHSIPIAFELSARHPEFETLILGATDSHLAYARHLASHYPGQNCTFQEMKAPGIWRYFARSRQSQLPPKLWTLFSNRKLLNSLDALVVPERTSSILKRIGVTRPKLIWTGHGAGDRARAYDSRLRLFDFVLLQGQKYREQMAERGLLREDGCAVVGYCKFEVIDKVAPGRVKLFDNDRPTVLYNPHFQAGLSSWPVMGQQVLEFFRSSDAYNLIFAPHIRAFDTASAAERARLEAYGEAPHIHVDLGSERSIDMTYTNAADLYLGDVSSQIYEFIRQPRPCLFLNAHGADWRDNPFYTFWQCGPVVDRMERLDAGLRQAFSTEDWYSVIQRRLFDWTFATSETPPSVRGAEAVEMVLKAA